MDYGFHISCKEGDGKTNEKKDGVEKINKRKKTEVKRCKHRAYDCIAGDIEKKKAHKSKVSK